MQWLLLKVYVSVFPIGSNGIFRNLTRGTASCRRDLYFDLLFFPCRPSSPLTSVYRRTKHFNFTSKWVLEFIFVSPTRRFYAVYPCHDFDPPSGHNETRTAIPLILQWLRLFLTYEYSANVSVTLSVISLPRSFYQFSLLFL